jgi:hypothetical protein
MFQMKERRLKLAGQGVEGAKDDDWQAVNCGSFLVHVMLPSKSASTITVCFSPINFCYYQYLCFDAFRHKELGGLGESLEASRSPKYCVHIK